MKPWPLAPTRLCSLVLVLTLALSPTPTSPRDEAPPAAEGTGAVLRYHRPVRGQLVDRFRMSLGPYGAGNRGWEYRTAPGTPVRAAAAGAVVFAGRVAGDLYVTVAHDDGLRSSYSYLATVAVSQGQKVGAGQVIGTTGSRFQVGFRRGEVYVDPATLFGPSSARLVPDDALPADRGGGRRPL